MANARRLHAALDDGSGRVALEVVKGAAHSALDRKNARALRTAVRRVHSALDRKNARALRTAVRRVAHTQPISL